MILQSRRDFLVGALLSAAVTSSASLTSPRVHASENNTLKLGIVGCGGRGCGAVDNALTADPNVKLVAAADVDEKRSSAQLDGLKAKWGDRVEINGDNLFIGFDSYKVLKPILISSSSRPQHFRPKMIKEAVDAVTHLQKNRSPSTAKESK